MAIALLALWATALPPWWCRCGTPAAQAAAVARPDASGGAGRACHEHRGHGSATTADGAAAHDGQCCCRAGRVYATETAAAEIAAAPVALVLAGAPVFAAFVARRPADSPAPVPKLLNSPYVRENPPLRR